MRRRITGFISVLIIACLMISVAAGCSGQSTSEQKTPEQSAQTGNAPSTTSVEKQKEEPVKFTIMLRAGPEFSQENNPWVEEINKKTNADITWMVVPIANIWEKRNIMMASNDYPEVIIMNTLSSGISDNLYDSMVQNKIILPVDEYIKNAPNIMEYTHQATWEAIRNADGKTYMVPRCTIIREDFMTNRKDWREKLNLPVPETIEDWKNLFKAVATKDPDGNGKADTYGVTDSAELMTLTGTINLEYFARAWNADKNWYDNGKGEVFYGVFAKDGRFKYALDFYRGLMQDKSLDPDLIINKGVNSKFEKFNKGIVAAQRYFAGNIDGDLNNTLRKIQPDADIEFVDFPTAPESANYKDEKLVLLNAGLYNGWALTKKAAGKEQRIVDVFDWLLGDEGWTLLKYGVEGVHYTKEGDKIVKNQAEYENYTKWSGHMMLFRRPNDEDLWLKKAIPELYPYQKEWLDKSVKYIDNYVQKGLMGITSQKETDFYKKDIFTKKYVEVVGNIIYGELPVSAWDSFLNEVYAAGWEEITKEYNEYYKSHK